ncbi:MAG TPA: PIG-L family deacetylase [Terriglobia bacterium]|nr:PIG-L family deacetylase [Terriglobia bacterium]
MEKSVGAAGASLLGLPLAESARGEEPATAPRKLKVIVVGGHHDDPESGCGGTMALYASQGHEVVSLYLTRGEAGIPGRSHDEAARIRTAESLRACEILKARALFAGQIDGATEVNPSRYKAFGDILNAEQPNLVFTHWPVDTHPDHRAASLLAYDAWLRASRKFALYYFEVESGNQTQNFAPSRYVDITATESLKRAACMAHVSQNPEEFYAQHDLMNRFRGMESGVKFAEGFIEHAQSFTRVPVEGI